MKLTLVKVMVLVLSYALLTACTSTTENEHYYVLGTSKEVVNAPLIESAPIVVLQPVKLVKYLHQPQLVMQIGDHKIQRANHHFWAEDLPDAISRELLEELDQQSTKFEFKSSQNGYRVDSTLNLHLQFSQFHPNDNSEVTIAGQYWLVNNQQKKVIISKDFLFKAELDADGYAHAVAKLHSLLKPLSSSILAAIN